MRGLYGRKVITARPILNGLTKRKVKSNMCKEIREKFAELYSLNVNEYVEKKQGLSYLSWSWAWAEFKKIYPDATYCVAKDENGRCYFGDEEIGYMVYTSVTAGGLTYEMWLPVMDNNNKAMKLNAYTYSTRNGEKTVEAVSMFDINKAVMRCLVKNLAMFGLGLYIYAGEDLPEDIKEYVCADCGKSVDSNMAQRTQKAFGACLCKDCGLKRSEQK
jgi:DNA-directed RNA polymerase subunit RPC12/RpoP